MVREVFETIRDSVDHWAKDSIAVANAYGIVSGYDDNNFGPNDLITREQMAVMVVKAAGLSSDANGKNFADSQNISDWAREAVAIAVSNNIISGYPDNTFRAKDHAIRAEAAIVLYNGLNIVNAIEEESVSTDYSNIGKAGTYGPETGIETVDCDVIVKAKDITLQNLIIKGDLIIGEEVGDGNVTLNNIKVEGKTYVRGGGQDSIHINGGEYNEIIIEKTATGAVRIVAVDTEGLQISVAEDAAGDKIILKGEFKEVAVKADDVEIMTQDNTTIDTIKVESGLQNISIELDADTNVAEMILDSKAAVQGEGNVEKASGKQASDSSFATKPDVISRPSTSSGGGGGGGGGSSSPSKIAIESIEITVDENDPRITIGQDGGETKVILVANVNDTLQMQHEVYPSNATDKSIEWKLEDAYNAGAETTIAEISDSGLLTVKETGNLYVKAYAKGGSEILGWLHVEIILADQSKVSNVKILTTLSEETVLGEVYIQTFTVDFELEKPINSAEIYYIVDSPGSPHYGIDIDQLSIPPNEAWGLYDEPFTVQVVAEEEPTTIYAIGIREGMEPSDISKMIIKFKDSSPDEGDNGETDVQD